MKRQEILQQISECQKRKEHYKKMFEWVEDYKLSLARSIVTETFNIKEYKKKLNEVKNGSVADS